MVIPISPSIWSAFGSTRYEDFGAAVSGVGDVNGDGYGDVLVGSPAWSGRELDVGRALLYLGGPGGGDSDPDWVLEGRQEAGILGDAVAGAGDVNGDGFADVIVGEPGFSSGGRSYRGRALLFLGTRHGLQSSPWWELAGSSERQYLGEWVAAAGDVNGDGLADVLVGGETGPTYLELGRRGTPERETVWQGPYAYRFGGVGDVNGDGYDDVGLSGGSETLLFLGSPAGLASDPAWSGPTAIEVSGGDVNGDGYSDVLLAPYPLMEGPVRLYYGSPAGPSSAPDWVGTDPGYSGWYGSPASARGDLNGDGFADIAVGDPGYNSGGQYPPEDRRPSVFVYFGGPAGPRADPDCRGVDQTSRSPDWSLDTGSDVDGDGASDLLVGVPGTYANGLYAGGALVYRLGEGYPVPRIVHDAPEPLVTEGTPIELEATITDGTHRVASAEIRYRLIEDYDFRPPVAMAPLGDGRYRGAIPAADVHGTGLVYSIRATDDYGLVGETILVGIEFLPAIDVDGTVSVRLSSSFPGRPDALLFRTRREGPARVRVFDTRGRLVRTVLDEPALAAGPHRVPLALEGARVAAGVYFYRVETVEGTSSGRFVRLR
ncbi:MAG: FG-GAP-like repeat-containing protein [Hyphomicrobiales bacterium]